MTATEITRARYGPWAVVAGASEGIGSAFAHRLAAQGIDLVLLARREPLLLELAQQLGDRYGVATRAIPLECGVA